MVLNTQVLKNGFHRGWIQRFMGFLKLVKEGLLSYFRSESYLMFSFQYILSLKGALDQFDE